MISDDIKIKILTEAIKTEAGWIALATSIKYSTNPHAKENAHVLLRIIGNEKAIKLAEANSDEVLINLSDQLIETFEQYMEKV